MIHKMIVATLSCLACYVFSAPTPNNNNNSDQVICKNLEVVSDEKHRLLFDWIIADPNNQPLKNFSKLILEKGYHRTINCQEKALWAFIKNGKCFNSNIQDDEKFNCTVVDHIVLGCRNKVCDAFTTNCLKEKNLETNTISWPNNACELSTSLRTNNNYNAANY
jgi:hypothetical protein